MSVRFCKKKEMKICNQHKIYLKQILLSIGIVLSYLSCSNGSKVSSEMLGGQGNVSGQCVGNTANNDIEVRKLIPPRLESINWGEPILCYRPGRNGSPKMMVEEKDGKIIAHNYGHDGMGWTVGPGSVKYVNDKLIAYIEGYKTGSSALSFSYNTDMPVTIVGGGVIGLLTAYDFIKRGYHNITVLAEKLQGNIASYNAGGSFALASKIDPEMQEILYQMGGDSYKVYASIATKTHPDFNNGAVIMPRYCESRTDAGLEPFVRQGVMQPAKDVELDFGNGTTRKMVAYDDDIFIDVDQMMANLTAYLKNAQIKFVEKKVQSFSEIEEKIIVNCSGLGAAILNNDQEMISGQGHLIMLKDQSPENLQYMISIHAESTDDVARFIYMMPKHFMHTASNDVGVIGGTLIKGATDQTPNDEEFNLLRVRTRQFFGTT